MSISVTAPLAEKIALARGIIFMKLPFFAHLLSKMTIDIVGEDDPRELFKHHGALASVSPDGVIYFNEPLWAEETVGLTVETLLHEILHPALNAWGRVGDRRVILSFPLEKGGQADGRISAWNLAHDASFNLDIVDLTKKYSWIETKGLFCDEKWRNLSAEEIYDLIVEQAEQNSKKKREAEGNPGGAGEGGGGQIRFEDLPEWLQELLMHANPDIAEGDEVDGLSAWGRMDADTRERLQRKWEQAVIEAEQMQARSGQGDLPASLKLYVDKIKQARITWGDALARWLGPYGRRPSTTYERRNRKQSAYTGFVMPGVLVEGLSEIVVFWDTSGSMYGREGEILSEIEGICDTMGVGIRILCIDAAIEADYRDVKSATEFIGASAERHVVGGGGSDFSDGFRLLEEEEYRGVVVAFTDGYITVPAEKPDQLLGMLWVLGVGSGVHDIKPATWGDELRLDRDGTAHFRK